MGLLSLLITRSIVHGDSRVSWAALGDWTMLPGLKLMADHALEPPHALVDHNGKIRKKRSY